MDQLPIENPTQGDAEPDPDTTDPDNTEGRDLDVDNPPSPKSEPAE